MNLGSDLSSDGPDMTVEGSDLKLGSDLETPQIQASHLKSEVRLGFSMLTSGSKVSSELYMLRSEGKRSRLPLDPRSELVCITSTSGPLGMHGRRQRHRRHGHPSGSLRNISILVARIDCIHVSCILRHPSLCARCHHEPSCPCPHPHSTSHCHRAEVNTHRA